MPISNKYASNSSEFYKKYKLSGITLNSEGVIKRIDKKLTTDNESDIINVKYTKSGDISKYCLNTILTNQEFLERHIRENPDEFWNAHIDDGKIILLTICKVHGYMYEFASKKLKADKDIIETALSSCGEILEKVPLIYRFNPYYVNLAVCNNGLALRFAPWVLQNDKDIVLKACNNNGKAFLYASKMLKIILNIKGLLQKMIV